MYPEGEGVDLALVPLAPPKPYQYKHVGIDSFATASVVEEEGIGVGDALVVPGLFTPRAGTKRNLPIVRRGNLAAMPEEPFVDDYGQPYQAYLAELRSIGGLSGSPVFVFLEPGRVAPGGSIVMGRKFFLLGLIRGHWDLTLERADVQLTHEEVASLNRGIAIVVPVTELCDLLMRDDLRKERRAEERRIAAQE